jgi:hypothetical protein
MTIRHGRTKVEGPYLWPRAAGIYLAAIIRGLHPRIARTIWGWYIEYDLRAGS